MDLRCEHKLHGKIADGLIEVRCQSSHCRQAHGAPIVFHYFDPIKGDLVKTTKFNDPADAVRSSSKKVSTGTCH